MDRDLVLRARGGDHVAFSELARRTIGPLTTVARVILHDEYLAQDAVQDALVDAITIGHVSTEQIDDTIANMEQVLGLPPAE